MSINDIRAVKNKNKECCPCRGFARWIPPLLLFVLFHLIIFVLTFDIVVVFVPFKFISVQFVKFLLKWHDVGIAQEVSM